jgi:hypothetical protein
MTHHTYGHTTPNALFVCHRKSPPLINSPHLLSFSLPFITSHRSLSLHLFPSLSSLMPSISLSLTLSPDPNPFPSHLSPWQPSLLLASVARPLNGPAIHFPWFRLPSPRDSPPPHGLPLLSPPSHLLRHSMPYATPLTRSKIPLRKRPAFAVSRTPLVISPSSCHLTPKPYLACVTVVDALPYI